MNGLILKDMFAMRSYFILVVALVLLLSTYFMIIDLGTSTIMVSAVIGSTMASSSFSVDNIDGWNQFSTSIGVSRRMMVDSKFTLGLMTMIMSLCIGIAVFIVETTIMGGNLSVDDLLPRALMGLGVGLAACAAICTVNYVIGPGRSQLVSGAMIGVFIALTISSGAVLESVFGPDGSLAGIGFVLAGMLIFALLRFACLRLFSKKDL